MRLIRAYIIVVLIEKYINDRGLFLIYVKGIVKFEFKFYFFRQKYIKRRFVLHFRNK